MIVFVFVYVSASLKFSGPTGSARFTFWHISSSLLQWYWHQRAEIVSATTTVVFRKKLDTVNFTTYMLDKY